MKVKLGTMLTIAAIVMILVGLGLTLMTGNMLGMINLDANPASIHFAKAVGGALIGLGIMAWLTRNAGPSPARNAVVLGLTAFLLLQSVEYIRAIIAGSLGATGWLIAAMWLALFLFMAMAGRSAMAEGS